MAFTFAAASSQYLTSATQANNFFAATTGLTISAWVRPNDTTTLRTVASVYRASSTGNFMTLLLAGNVAGDPVQWQTRPNGSPGTASTSTSYLANVWQHVCGVEASSSDRRVYLNGGGKGTNATNVTAGNCNTARIASAAGIGNFADGRIAHVAIWTAALNDSEVLALSLGCSPLRIRSANLIAYWPLYGFSLPAMSYIGALSLTATGTPTQSDGPPMMGPISRNLWGYLLDPRPTPPGPAGGITGPDSRLGVTGKQRGGAWVRADGVAARTTGLIRP